MQEIIEKLLILQDRDRRILRLKEQLARIEPERQAIQGRAGQAQGGLDQARSKVKMVETDRKKLELEAETKKGQIEKYSLQQFQTKKNEEYRALAHEIEGARAAIRALEDQQLELMQQAEDLQRQAVVAQREADNVKKAADGQLKDLAEREKNLAAELAGLSANRDALTAGIDETTLRRYDRLLRSKGDSIVVGIEHGVCGGCHMKFPTQILVSCQAAKEIINCPNCGRILYYTRDMDLVVAE